MDDALYAEPSLQGNAVIAPRKADSPETQINLELLFNAVTQGRI
jgi:ABC-2 type transport system ATP-binding protein